MIGFYDALDPAVPFADVGADPIELEVPPLVRISQRDLDRGIPVDAEAMALRASDPGQTPLQVEQSASEQLDNAVISGLVAEVRASDAAYNRNSRLTRTEAETDAEIDKLASARAESLGVTPEALSARIKVAFRGLFGLEKYLDSPTVSDIDINRFDDVWVEDDGVMRKVPSPFVSKHDLEQLVTTRLGLLRETGQDRGAAAPSVSHPIADWNAVYYSPIGPINVRGNVVHPSQTTSGQFVVSLRKAVASGFDHLDRWYRADDPDAPMTEQVARFLREIVRRRGTLLIAGGTGSGKTSLLKALLNEEPAGMRILTIEESEELRLSGENQLGMVASPNAPLADLIRAAMRQRPDIIIVGECREGPEVTAWINAANSGHPGSITTTHADSAEDALYRLLNLNAEADTKSSQEYFGSRVDATIDVVVFIGMADREQADGTRRRIRRVVEICLVSDFSMKSGKPVFSLNSLFGRYIDRHPGTRPATEIGLPLRGLGPAQLTQRFKDRMRSRGLPVSELNDLLTEPLTGDPFAPKE